MKKLMILTGLLLGLGVPAWAFGGTPIRSVHPALHPAKTVVVCASRIDNVPGYLCVSRRTDGSDANKVVKHVLLFVKTTDGGMLGVWRPTSAAKSARQSGLRAAPSGHPSRSQVMRACLPNPNTPACRKLLGG